jgi:hypothetical protein
MSLTAFDVYGPHEVPFELRPNGRWIPTGCPAFWEDHSSLAERHGCYVFVIRSGRGYKPWYVGKAARLTFGKECFNHRNSNCYNRALQDTRKGTPMLFLLAERAR